ncbi:ion transporter [Paraflavisolibacter sp. H34]|uniref:ion transporter n=1 Tax=Huijunlia imazamoxiresistens TaxID=3127457 RepID=UPI00301A57E7
MEKHLKERLCRIVFGTDTRGGKLFDIVLLWIIVLSVIVVILESMPGLNRQYQQLFYIVELIFTGLFTVEYLLRVLVSPRPFKYIFSYLGIIDLLSVLPFYLGLIVPGYHYFMVLRLLRMLRVFRILRLFRFVRESEYLFQALKASMYKVIVFILFVVTLVILLGTIMYVVEGPSHGFTSIPNSIYWTIVTITTVGYGDITPETGLGKWIASLIMLCGYAIIAVPTGIVTVEMVRHRPGGKVCNECRHDNPSDARYCNFCGHKLEQEV